MNKPISIVGNIIIVMLCVCLFSTLMWWLNTVSVVSEEITNTLIVFSLYTFIVSIVLSVGFVIQTCIKKIHKLRNYRGV